MLPHGKQNVAWVGEDTLLVSREWNPGELTASGYPFIVKRLARGQPLVGRRRGLPRHGEGRFGVTPLSDVPTARAIASVIVRGVSFFEIENSSSARRACTKLGVPLRRDPSGHARRAADRQALRAVDDGGAERFAAGSLASFDARAGGGGSGAPRADRRSSSRGPASRVDGASATRDRLVATLRERARPGVRLHARHRRNVDARSTAAFPTTWRSRSPTSNPHGTDALLNVDGLSHAEQRLARRRARGIDRRGQDAARRNSMRRATRSSSAKRRRRTEPRSRTSSCTRRR